MILGIGMQSIDDKCSSEEGDLIIDKYYTIALQRDGRLWNNLDYGGFSARKIGKWNCLNILYVLDAFSRCIYSHNIFSQFIYYIIYGHSIINYFLLFFSKTQYNSHTHTCYYRRAHTRTPPRYKAASGPVQDFCGLLSS